MRLIIDTDSGQSIDAFLAGKEIGSTPIKLTHEFFIISLCLLISASLRKSLGARGILAKAKSVLH
ncbi:hypothetical protein N8652_00895 [bacterium]|nr:hypothetical protein [bacterium]